MEQMAIAKMADRNRDAVRHRRAYEARARPPQPVRTAIERPPRRPATPK